MQYVSGTARPMVGDSRPCPFTRAEGVAGCEGCDTILSIYNPTDYCGLHARDCEPEETTFTRRRNDGDVISRTCAYEGCQHTFETANARRAVLQRPLPHGRLRAAAQAPAHAPRSAASRRLSRRHLTLKPTPPARR